LLTLSLPDVSLYQAFLLLCCPGRQALLGAEPTSWHLRAPQYRTANSARPVMAIARTRVLSAAAGPLSAVAGSGVNAEAIFAPLNAALIHPSVSLARQIAP
jgi:hypothetical protein